MNWTNIKRWAKDKGYKVDREKSGDEANPYNYEWHLIDNPSEKEFELNSLEDLSEILKIDASIMIFKSKLEGISKYKLKDLENMCKEHNIDIMKNGKKKLKKQLYDDISLCLMKNE